MAYLETCIYQLRKLFRTGCQWKSYRYARMSTSINLPKPEYDFDYLCSARNKEEIMLNIIKRKGVGDINKVQELYHKLVKDKLNKIEREAIELKLNEEASLIPNKSHPQLIGYDDEPKVITKNDIKRNFSFEPREFSDLAHFLKLIRTDMLGNFVGHKSYYLLGDLAQMEQALVLFTIDQLQAKGFRIVSVPDILPKEVIERCGLKIKGDRTQVYELDPEFHENNLCLSGTSEMALAAYLMNSVFPEKELPIKLTAVSRCFRAETSRTTQERGIYRVHQFTKVEMFGACKPDDSSEMLQEFCEIQEEMFSLLGLPFQTLDMPLHELGAPAYRKFDVEAWMPGRKMFGEISSCSNCTDYQSRRLNIRYTPEVKLKNSLFVHTLNGTACAIPRMLIAIVENYQQEDRSILIPETLHKYMEGKTVIRQQSNVPSISMLKSKYKDKRKKNVT